MGDTASGRTSYTLDNGMHDMEGENTQEDQLKLSLMELWRTITQFYSVFVFIHLYVCISLHLDPRQCVLIDVCKICTSRWACDGL